MLQFSVCFISEVFVFFISVSSVQKAEWEDDAHTFSFHFFIVWAWKMTRLLQNKKMCAHFLSYKKAQRSITPVWHQTAVMFFGPVQKYRNWWQLKSKYVRVHQQDWGMRTPSKSGKCGLGLNGLQLTSAHRFSPDQNHQRSAYPSPKDWQL